MFKIVFCNEMTDESHLNWIEKLSRHESKQ